MARCSKDPLRFVQFAFPWGEGELADHQGPDDWQVDLLKAIRDGLITAQTAVQIAVASGHGIGKSAFVAWIILWAISTFEDTRGVVTANTDTQLRTKTWPELTKWHRRCICKHWFEVTATAIYAKDPAHEKNWRIDLVPWSEKNTEAFAGLHNEGKRILLVFDEASAIPETIWNVSEGALTDENTEILWFVAGNPTRNVGRFRECFGRFKHRWITRQIDSRKARMTNKVQIAQWVKDYGEDSDFVRIRVRGVFPKAATTQFIRSDVIEAAASPDREAIAQIFDPFIIGVDAARFGDDQSVIYFRKGRDGRTHPPLKFRGIDTMQLAARVAEQWKFFNADAVFVDGGGLGAGVVDRLRQLNVPVIEVQFGSSPDRSQPGQEDVAYANKRAEMWGNMREWLKGGAIPDDQDLKSELEGVEYGFVIRDGRDAILLEKKEDMKKRGLASPDVADALALTFAYPVMPNVNAGRYAHGAGQITTVQSDYDPFNEPRGNVQREYDPFHDS